MNQLTDLLTDELYLTGQCVPSGVYRELSTQREIRVEEQERLPAGLDGGATAYVCIQYTWGAGINDRSSAHVERRRAS